MTDRPSFDPFEQRIAAEFERYVQPATDPKPISAIVGAAMRPRGLAVRVGNQSRPRRFLLLGIAAAFLVPATYLAAGSLQPPTADPSDRLPPPFGPARNGLIATSINGDIVTVDPATGAKTVIIAGPETDTDPIFSSLGTQLLFFRTAPGQAQYGMGDALFMADADGSSVRQLVSGKPDTGQHSPWLPWFDLTADGRRLIYVTCCGDGSTGSPQILDTVTGATTTALTGSAKSPLPAAFTGRAMWRPGHDEYVFAGDLNQGARACMSPRRTAPPRRRSPFRRVAFRSGACHPTVPRSSTCKGMARALCTSSTSTRARIDC